MKTGNSIEKEEKTINLLQNYQQPASESLVVNNSICEIVYGEKYSTERLLYVENCQELAFLQHFNKGRFGYAVGHQINSIEVF